MNGKDFVITKVFLWVTSWNRHIEFGTQVFCIDLDCQFCADPPFAMRGLDILSAAQNMELLELNFETRFNFTYC